MSDNELLPCAFCGEESATVRADHAYKERYYCMCFKCRAHCGYGTKEEVVNSWNTRAPVPQRPEREVDEEKLLGVIAQGWCTKRNSNKEMDVNLAEDIAKAIAAAWFTN